MSNTDTITLGGKVYQVAKRGEQGMDLIGKRGATYALVQNVRNPARWALITNHMKPRTEWYTRTESGEFVAL